MKIEQVAAQTYTVRDYLKTPADIAATLKKIKRIGFSAVQLSGLGPIDSSELGRIVAGEGLICCATHESGETILENPKSIVEKLNILGCTYTAYPYPAGVDLSSTKAVKAFAKKLDAAGKVLADAGKVLTYHNHHLEFRKLRGRAILEMLYEETDSRYLQGELDTHWVQAGGASVEAWCRKLAGRLPLLHLKDFGLDEQNERVFAEIGTGNLNWQEIVAAAERSGCQWYIVEQDNQWLDNDPFKSLKQSFKYLRAEIAE
jgi:sugar phosphate isomerase/epimerase